MARKCAESAAVTTAWSMFFALTDGFCFKKDNGKLSRASYSQYQLSSAVPQQMAAKNVFIVAAKRTPFGHKRVDSQ